jgi:hypothetical protein
MRLFLVTREQEARAGILETTSESLTWNSEDVHHGDMRSQSKRLKFSNLSLGIQSVVARVKGR